MPSRRPARSPRATGLTAVADDTGLEVDALDGRPGVYAARYAGEHATYEDNCRKLVQELEGVPHEQTDRSIYHGSGHRRTGRSPLR